MVWHYPRISSLTGVTSLPWIMRSYCILICTSSFSTSRESRSEELVGLPNNLWDINKSLAYVFYQSLSGTVLMSKGVGMKLEENPKRRTRQITLHDDEHEQRMKNKKRKVNSLLVLGLCKKCCHHSTTVPVGYQTSLAPSSHSLLKLNLFNEWQTHLLTSWIEKSACFGRKCLTTANVPTEGVLSHF